MTPVEAHKIADVLKTAWNRRGVARRMIDAFPDFNWNALVLRNTTALGPPDQDDWPKRKAELEARALEEWDTDKNTGECLLCDRSMRQHPPERMFRADPSYCPR